VHILSPFRVVFVFIILAILGLACIPYLDINLLPKDKSQSLNVRCALPNSSPLIVESGISQLLENAFSGMKGLKEMKSISRYNRAEISLEFWPSIDMEYTQFEAASIIRRMYHSLPPDAGYPQVDHVAAREYNSTTEAEKPLLIYSINAPEMPFSIKQRAGDFFRKELTEWPDLKEIRLTGTEDLECVLKIDDKKIDAFNITISDVQNIIRDYTKVTYPGALTSGDGASFFIRIKSEDVSKNELSTIPVNASVRLKDIAEINLEEKPISGYFRVNGKNSIRMMLLAREGSNRIVLADQIKEKIVNIKSNLPAGYEMRLEQDDTAFFKKELNKNYRRSVAALGILILFLLFSYRSWRMLFVLMTSLFVNLCITALAAWALNIPVHMYSLAGLSISFGIMIDNSIVSLDYFHQYKNRHIVLAIMGATLTTVAALLLIFLLPMELRKNLSDFALMVSISLGVSILVSLAFTPGMYRLLFSRLYKDERVIELNHLIKPFSKLESYYFKIISFLARYRKSFIAITILMFGLPVFLLPGEWKGHSWYNRMMSNEWYLEHVKPIIDRALGGSLRLFIRDVYEKSGYRDPQQTKLYVSARMKYGTTIEQMNTILTEFEQYLQNQVGIDQYITSIFSGQNGFIDISFKPEYESSSLPWQLKSRLTSKATDWSAVEWAIYGVGQGFSTYHSEQIPSFRVLMKGYNYDELEKQATILESKLKKHPRIQKVNTNERLNWNDQSSSEYILSTNSVAMAQSNINQYALFQSIQHKSQPVYTGVTIAHENKFYPIVLKNQGSDRYDLWDITNSPLKIDSNQTTKLGSLTSLGLVQTASAIHKQDRNYIRLVAFEYLGSEHFGSKYLNTVLDEMKDILPVGYTATRETWRWGSDKAKKQYSLLILLILANYFICALLFESLRLPFYIILTIPVSFIGLFLIFSWGGFYFDQGGYAAFLMLGGLVVNAAIFIVHDYQQGIKKSTDYNHTLIKVTTNRARTILQTTLSAICSLLPFIWEGQKEIFWFSLAIGVMGGLVFSMWAVFVVLPVVMWGRV
jgi:multidrug efflux pump subunit AcrB